MITTTTTAPNWPTVNRPRPDKKCLVANLGYSMARVETAERALPDEPNRMVRLYIVTPSTTDDNVHSPAESVEVYGLDSLIALRDLLDEGIAIAQKGTFKEPVANAINEQRIKQ